MINLDQLKQEVSDITHEFDRKVAMQVIDYLSENGYLKDEWQPIETAPKDEKVLLGCWSDGKWYVDCGKKLNKNGCMSVLCVGFRKNEWPTHWMPLLKPPKGEQNDH